MCTGRLSAEASTNQEREPEMTPFPLQSTSDLTPDPPESARPNGTLADTDGELDWEKVTRLAWRPAWAIRSRRGALATIRAMLRRGP